MAITPPGVRIQQAGLAYQGAPAGLNPNAADLKNPAAAQLQQAAQQTAVQQSVRGEAQQAAASALAHQYKQALQRVAVSGDPNALPGLRAIADQPQLAQPSSIGLM